MKTEDVMVITKGNEYAANFVINYVKFCHLLDDVVDRDADVTDQRIVAETLAFLEELVANPWVKDNIALLWPLVVAGANAWVDANNWPKVTQEQRITADVLKSQYHEVVWFVARLCGGHQHQKEITSQFREFDFDYKGKI